MATTAFVRTETQLAVNRFALGLAEGGVLASMLVLIRGWFTQAERGRANAVFLISLAAGGNDLLRPKADPEALAARFEQAVVQLRPHQQEGALAVRPAAGRLQPGDDLFAVRRLPRHTSEPRLDHDDAGARVSEGPGCGQSGQGDDRHDTSEPPTPHSCTSGPVTWRPVPWHGLRPKA